jgi:hypothetical protein
LEPGEYVNYFANVDNGLTRSKTFEHLNFEVSLLNKDVLAIKSAFGNPVEIAKCKKEILGLTYFTVKISSDKLKDPFYTGISDQASYQERIRHSNSAVAKDFSVEYNNKIYECKQVVFEPTHSISPYAVLSLVFDSLSIPPEFISDVKLVYDDKLFSLGTMKFNFKKEDLNNTPNLKL